MPEPSKKLCNRYDVLAWGGAVLALITLEILPASVSANFLTAVFAFASLIGFLMIYLRDNFVGSLLAISGFFLVIFLFAMQSSSGVTTLANFGSYFGGVLTPIGVFVAFVSLKKQLSTLEDQRNEELELAHINELIAAFDELKLEAEHLKNAFDYSQFFNNTFIDYWGFYSQLFRNVEMHSGTKKYDEYADYLIKLKGLLGITDQLKAVHAFKFERSKVRAKYSLEKNRSYMFWSIRQAYEFSYYVKFRQPLNSTGTTYDLRLYDFVKAAEGSVFGEYALVNFDRRLPAMMGSSDRIQARKLRVQACAERASAVS
ncbi:hypothetical protein [Oceanospirillum sanctuarii]|uniref:hypothetical protein n=1 Tax=Oceanospirillum sanctuarii TaxID=1434821 RepID=UPI000A37F14B|nr:hypothetical protein [Oceanospirillum sanctuarii]